MDNLNKVRRIIPLWYAHRKWAEELLMRSFNFETAQQILKPENRGNKPIPGKIGCIERTVLASTYTEPQMLVELTLTSTSQTLMNGDYGYFLKSNTMKETYLSQSIESCMKTRDYSNAL